MNPSAISSPTYPAPMMIAVLGLALDQMLVQREGIAHGVHHMDAVVGTEHVQAGDAGAGRQRAGADDQFVVVEDGLAV